MESSDGYSTDEKKRKAEEEARTVFGTSKKTQRSPKLERKDGDKLDQILKLIKDGDKLDQILKLMTEMKSDQKLIKEEIHCIRTEQEDFKNEIKRLTGENEELREENEVIRKENREIKEELKEQRRLMNIYEKDRKKSNLVLTGMTITPTYIKKSLNTILNFGPISGRIATLRVKLMDKNVTVVNIYAPTEMAEEHEKDEFYKLLTNICEEIPKKRRHNTARRRK
ncbi:hypothetical protein QE152_g19569 [Popillia japonica]|uniref:Uncharacterized protein n=1 Tax=Popillia japonica TaxID=7064 RepID=A0AAW1KNI6_POPJA